MLGTRGVPARYGGFETAVEEVGSRLVQRGHEVTVYCRNPGQKLHTYRGMRLKNMPAVRHRVAETLSHTTVSVAHAVLTERPDVVLLMNAANAPLLRPLRFANVPTAIHLDGLESRREKWRGLGARYYQWAEEKAIAWGDVVIADAQSISDYVSRTYGRQCEVIAYGAKLIDPVPGALEPYDLRHGHFHLIVSRFEPENHVLEAVHAYRRSEESRPLVVIGSTAYSDWYAEKVHAAAEGDDRIRFLDSIYDQVALDQFYAQARSYIHGHSVGGTNPSLLRAMGGGSAVLAFDVEFNREVTAGNAFFWRSADELTKVLNRISAGGEDQHLDDFARLGRSRVADTYQWDAVTDRYESMLTELHAGNKES